MLTREVPTAIPRSAYPGGTVTFTFPLTLHQHGLRGPHREAKVRVRRLQVTRSKPVPPTDLSS